MLMRLPFGEVLEGRAAPEGLARSEARPGLGRPCQRIDLERGLLAFVGLHMRMQAQGNVCSVIAQNPPFSLPYGVAYPILQCALVFGGLWGIYAFSRLHGVVSMGLKDVWSYDRGAVPLAEERSRGQL